MSRLFDFKAEEVMANVLKTNLKYAFLILENLLEFLSTHTGNEEMRHHR